MIGASEAVLLLENFVQGIREHPSFQDAWLIFCCERNMAHEAGFLTEPFLKFRKTVAIAQHETKDYGWWYVFRLLTIRINLS